MRKLLWVGDAGCDSGFARCTHKILDVLQHLWDVSVIGINYRGDPEVRRQYPYDIYPSYVIGGPKSVLGAERIAELWPRHQWDAIVIQNDPWWFPRYLEQIDRIPDGKRPVVIGAVAIDGKNANGRALNGIDHAIFWTKFGRDEAVRGGYFGTSGIVPLGVDLTVYKPRPKYEARDAIGIPRPPRDGFIILNVNRNQPRKRIDLTIRYFAEFFHKHCPRKDAYLYLHVCPTGDVGVDVDQMAAYYGLKGHVLLEQPGVYEGFTEEELALTYQASDIQVSTTHGEGWGLTTMEGMACGTPQVVPDWSALGEWAAPAAALVPCTSTSVSTGGPNVIGGVPDEKEFVSTLKMLYNSPSTRAELSARGLALVNRPEFRWENIGAAFAEEVERAFMHKVVQRALDSSVHRPERNPGDAGEVRTTP
jgi:D-inositol-3-phosphate glycosyltransferase